MLMAAAVLKFITLFKSWNQIQDGHQRTSPSMAVGFCFIPIFHFYWVFVAVRGLAVDMNAYLRRYNIPAPPISEGLALALCISSVALLPMLFIPIINIAAGIGVIVLAYIFWYQVRIANMAIAQAKLTAAAQAGTLRTT